MKQKIIKAKILRYLGITKPIELDKYEVRWIKLCKGHYNKKYDISARNWIDALKPMFEEIYGWSPDERNKDFLQCIFNKLLDIHMKIMIDGSGKNQQIKDVFAASFDHTYRRNYQLPIERAIAELCGQIQYNLVIENGVPRYHLNDTTTP